MPTASAWIRGQASSAVAEAVDLLDTRVAGARNALREDELMRERIGRRRCALAEGYIPPSSQGPEPQTTSHVIACVLNPNDQDAYVATTVFFADREPVGPYRVTVPARRTRHIGFNQLDDPEPIPKDTDYASMIESTCRSSSSTRASIRARPNSRC